MEKKKEGKQQTFKQHCKKIDAKNKKTKKSTAVSDENSKQSVSSVKEQRKLKCKSQELDKPLCKSSPENKLAGLCCRGLRPASSIVDRELWEWYCQARAKEEGFQVTKRMVQARAKRTYREAGLENFKASDGWYRRWISRWRRFGNNENFKTGQSFSKLLIDDGTNKTVSCTNKKVQLQNKTVEPEKIMNGTIGKILKENTTTSETVTVFSEPTDSHSGKRQIPIDVQNNASECSSNKYIKLNDKGRVCSSESELDKQSSDTSKKNDNETELSTPMLNIVDYLPSEIMQNLEGDISEKSVRNNAESTYQVPNMDCLYYPSSYELLSDCDNDTLFDSIQYGIPANTDPEQLRDLVGFISPSQLHNTSLNGNTRDTEHLNSEDSEDFVDSIFRNVALSMEEQDDNSNGAAVNQDVLSPEVILEQQNSCTEIVADGKFISTSNKETGISQRKRGERYLPQFKLKVLTYASNHTLRETSNKFKVNDGTIISWRKEKNWKEYLLQNSGISRNNGVKKEETPLNSVDLQFLTWLRRCREQGCDILRTEVMDKARQLAEQTTFNNWFKMWVARFDSDLEETYTETTVPKRDKHIQYPQAFKMEVASFAERHSQLVAARVFNVSRKRVFDWLKIFKQKFVKDSSKNDIEKLGQAEEEDSNKKERRSDLDKQVDQEVWMWYQVQQKNGSKPNWHEVQAKGLELYRAKGNADIKCSYQWYKRWCNRFHLVLRHEGDDALLEWALTQLEMGHCITFSDLQVQALNFTSDNAFKASHGWAIRFCKRHPELLQQNPMLDTALPCPMLKKVDDFRSEVQQVIRDKNLALGCIGNMDELCLNFSVLLSGSNAKRQLLMRKSEMENCHATIVLACLADGNILPPAVIVKVSAFEDLGPLADNMVVLQQEEGLMDAACLDQWLQLVWFKCVQGPNLLLLDCLNTHTGDSIAAQFSQHKSTRFIIPGGCTSKLQPLDVSLKNLFHAFIQKKWIAFNSSSSGTWDTGENKLHLPGCRELVNWVSATYHDLQTTEQEAVRRSFLVTGLTVAANRSEDHFIENLSMIPKPTGSSLL